MKLLENIFKNIYLCFPSFFNNKFFLKIKKFIFNINFIFFKATKQKFLNNLKKLIILSKI